MSESIPTIDDISKWIFFGFINNHWEHFEWKSRWVVTLLFRGAFCWSLERKKKIETNSSFSQNAHLDISQFIPFWWRCTQQETFAISHDSKLLPNRISSAFKASPTHECDGKFLIKKLSPHSNGGFQLMLRSVFRGGTEIIISKRHKKIICKCDFTLGKCVNNLTLLIRFYDEQHFSQKFSQADFR